MVAVISFVLTKKDVRGVGAAPFTLTSTIELLPAKFLPVTVSKKAGEPAATLVGETDLRMGFGLLMICWQDGNTTAVKTSIPRASRDFSCKLITPESVGPLCPLERNRRDY